MLPFHVTVLGKSEGALDCRLTCATRMVGPAPVLNSRPTVPELTMDALTVAPPASVAIPALDRAGTSNTARNKTAWRINSPRTSHAFVG